jgi:hypothetical protein
LDFSGSYSLANFSLASDGNGGTIVYDPPVQAAYASAPLSAVQFTIGSAAPSDGFDGSATAGVANNASVTLASNLAPGTCDGFADYNGSITETNNNYNGGQFAVTAPANNGTLTPDAQTLVSNAGSFEPAQSSLVGSAGSATIGAGATLEIASAASASVTFQGSTGTLQLDEPATFTGEIYGFTGDGTLSGSDQIDLRGLDYNSVSDSYVGNVLTVSDGGGDTANLDFNGAYSLANFSFASDGDGGTIVYDPPVQAANSSAPLLAGQFANGSAAPSDDVDGSATAGNGASFFAAGTGQVANTDCQPRTPSAQPGQGQFAMISDAHLAAYDEWQGNAPFGGGTNGSIALSSFAVNQLHHS